MRRIVAIWLTVAGLVSGCDRVVNLTPFYDAQPAPDGGVPALDGNTILDTGSATPDDGSPDDGNLNLDSGSPVLDGSR